jgi:uncharacterized protein YwqG
MDIHEIKNRLVKKATALAVGAFKPTGSDKESWIGRVAFYKEEESIPEDSVGLPMLPLLQLSLEGLPFVPEGLENTKMLTVFISEDLPTGLADNGDDWLLVTTEQSEGCEREGAWRSSSAEVPQGRPACP